MTAEHRVRGAGIGSAGPVHLPTGTVSPVNLTAWRDFPIRDRVPPRCPACRSASAVTGVHGARRALARRRTGSARSCSAWWCRRVSAAGWCSTAHRTTAAPATPDTSVTWSSTPTVRPVPCGGRGCVEAIAGGPRMAQWAREQRLGRAAGGRRQGARRAAAAAGDAVALRAFERGCDRGRGDDRVGGRGVRSRPGGHRRWCGEIRRRCCSTRCGLRWPATPGWISSRTYKWCPRNSAVTPAGGSRGPATSRLIGCARCCATP